MNKKNIIKIIKIKPLKDGSAIVDIEYDESLKDTAKKYYKRKRCTEKLIERLILEAIDNYMIKEIGENNEQG